MAALDVFWSEGHVQTVIHPFCLCKQREEHTPTAAEYSFRKCTAWDCVPQVERQGAAPEKHQGQIGFPDADRDYTPQDRWFFTSSASGTIIGFPWRTACTHRSRNSADSNSSVKMVVLSSELSLYHQNGVQISSPNLLG